MCVAGNRKPNLTRIGKKVEVLSYPSHGKTRTEDLNAFFFFVTVQVDFLHDTQTMVTSSSQVHNP